MEVVKTIALPSGGTLEIIQDSDPESPRTWDNVGTMVCFHKGYCLGDEDHGYSQKEFASWGELEVQIIKDYKPAVIFPLYLYDHSGITMNVSGFSHCDPQRWDWGQVGFIFVSKEKARKEFGKLDQATLEQVRQCLLGEVEVYDMFLRGEVYGFVHKSVLHKNGHIEDSCWGFYGYDPLTNGMADHLSEDIVKQLKS